MSCKAELRIPSCYEKTCLLPRMFFVKIPWNTVLLLLLPAVFPRRWGGMFTGVRLRSDRSRAYSMRFVPGLGLMRHSFGFLYIFYHIPAFVREIRSVLLETGKDSSFTWQHFAAERLLVTRARPGFTAGRIPTLRVCGRR